MMLTQFAMISWYDLAALILAGIITAAVIGQWHSRKQGENGRQAAVMAMYARSRPQG